MKVPAILFATAVACGLSTAAAPPATAPSDPLRAGFVDPPVEARPQTWWHWMNGNITKAGITADLEAMKSVGLGGATIVNVDCGIPAGPVKFMSPAWREDFRFAVSEADRLGLHLCVENCAGWSSSGGPWNTPANAMQCLTASQRRTAGPARLDAILDRPPTRLGLYHDIAVLAFHDAAPEVAPTTAPTSSPATLPVITRAVFGVQGGPSVDVTAKVVALAKAGETSVVVNNDQLGGDPAEGQAKRLRVDYTFAGRPGTVTVDEGDTLTLPIRASAPTTRRKARKPANGTFVRPLEPTGPADTAAIPRDGILDLTDQLTPDGRLTWDVPPGRWVIMRVGYTPVGVDNHPAPLEGRGLECDKMSTAALDAHWDGFLQKVLNDLGPLAGRTLDATLIDSYEVGGQDWTGDFRHEFQARRGYDPVPFLPTFAGHVVGSPAVTERFLWDVRRTVADLFAERYYGHFSELCHRHGLSSVVEPYTGPFESLQCGGTADEVMGEFWTGSQGHPSVKMAASIAHIYGKTTVGAESFTASSDAGRWQNDPYSEKALGDLMFCQGLNRCTFHRYAMQPWTDRSPGMTMGPWGFMFERTITWWDQAHAWTAYLARCQFLLRQGRALSDIAYFTGETAPVEMRVGNPAAPLGYDYDAVDADVLLHGATVDAHGRLTLASGASYAVLVLPPGDRNLTPPVADAIRKLVLAGATVVGPRPQHSPSLNDYPSCDVHVKAVADQLWGACDGVRTLENAAGQGHVVWGRPLADVFAAQHLTPDFEFHGSAADSHLTYVHRVAGSDDVYFVSNQRQRFDAADCTFRVAGKVPEVWHPDTGVVEPAPVWSEHDGRTTVRLTFDPVGSCFVVFRRPAGPIDHVVAADAVFAGTPADTHTLTIQHAVYAAADGTGSADVTAALSSRVHDGGLTAEVSNTVLGSDPSDMHKKELRVDYTLDGKPGHVTVREHQTLSLNAGDAAGRPPTWEVTTLADDGSPVVRAWGDGTATLRTAGGLVLHATADGVPAAEPLAGPWTLTFPPHWGAPPSVTLDHLISWTDHADDGVRYFSGTGTYTNTCDVDASRLAAGRELWLDLGRVKNLAQVSLNGRDLGVLWKPPFRVNVTGAAHAGSNALIVKVTNLWPNRLIGDEQLPPDCQWIGQRLAVWPQWLLDGKPSPTGRLTFTTWHHWDKDAPLLPSGLLGPVTLRTVQWVPAR
jgi:hypothetical protein